MQNLLNNIPELIKRTFPIPGKFRSKLPSDIAELSRLLTSSRGERSLSYLSRPNYLSAYLHYFLPWNILRLCVLLPKLELNLAEGDIITDYGCGPLTFACALWISRPDLRNVSLEFNCVDKTASVLEAGKKFFTALSAFKEADAEENDVPVKWKINLIKKDININKSGENQNKSKNIQNETGKSKNSNLICAVNMFNEMYDRISHNNTEELRRMAANAASFLRREAAKDASILIVEPGVPQSGRFISVLREAFIDLGHTPASPCAHSNPCPMMRENLQYDTRSSQQHNAVKHKKDKWCHFAFDANDAPKELKRLSAAAKLPKDRLVFSYLLTDSNQNDSGNIRVISDAFALPYGKFGRYACSHRGLILLAGEKNAVEKLEPLSLAGSLAPNGKRASKEEYDEKSGALIIEVT
ncbi:MAG: small ribosomal subunit Rsm22 family protein [Treponema sp.]|nr:small ribosomal subunit Rsm22 family protein [Treponema sp.]